MSSFSYFEHSIKSRNWAVKAVPALSDNFMYLLIDKVSSTCAVIDAVEPEKVVEAAKEEKCSISHILTTHSHWDHDGGNEKLAKMLGKEVPVIGGSGDDVQAVTKEVSDGDEFMVGNISVKTLMTPFHTPGHVCFFVDHDGDRAVFTGDTLFVGGCGNLNDGTKDQLHSAFRKLGELPSDTLVYCGHEYTIANFAYATSLEPTNETLRAKKLWAEQKRSSNEYTIPSTIGEEFETSPFMKAAFGKSDEISQVAGITQDDTASMILWVRQDKSAGSWKNRLRL